jgi:hypothetical protein
MDNGGRLPRHSRTILTIPRRPARRRPSARDDAFFSALQSMQKTSGTGPAPAAETKHPAGMEKNMTSNAQARAASIVASEKNQLDLKLKQEYTAAALVVGMDPAIIDDELTLAKEKGLVGWKEDGNGGWTRFPENFAAYMREFIAANPSKRKMPETAREARQNFLNK